MCASSPVFPSIVCTDGGEIPTLEIVVRDPSACFCGETIACSASQDGTRIDLEVRAEACGPLCEACFRELRGSCSLEGIALSPSPIYDVSINGTLAISGLQVGGPECFNPALPVSDSLICAWPGTALAASDVTSTCIPSDAAANAPIVVRTTACVDCFTQEAGCMLREDAGGTYQVTPLVRACDCPSCGACLPECQLRELYCTLPPLPSGEYQIQIAGRAQTTTLRVSETGTGTGNESCAAPP